ncbi:hypothetical protein NCU17157 [Neurospora crassa OR74A]|uniref:Uncharacterized protein n=1 Tax=Neurospora crassa (strain ATCC 24698 / 74-OR23-1A / CBS 708.71 / DSM 1257 / FGSC 987) TaxID=367110 RepID=V5IM56_NEUCR|nr:hypothetical protein NCU17157 [Neurospora crassa OR74A]ESA41801.1 hypothetical protein NCU17157 [Neurospora crassa OR74A]|eukprot:XP_011395346.1 hypothetical protein NCU17157 [Neurospora crassa OR74A]
MALAITPLRLTVPGTGLSSAVRMPSQLQRYDCDFEASLPLFRTITSHHHEYAMLRGTPRRLPNRGSHPVMLTRHSSHVACQTTSADSAALGFWSCQANIG